MADVVASKPCRVLVVDDEPMIVKSIRRAFPKADVVGAHSGAQAVEVLQGDDEFDLILCDMMMPDMTGMKVYATVQQHRAATAQRFVFMTGGTFLPELREFLSKVPNRCLKKPFSVDSLRQLLPAIDQ
jgi:CheY-like chemotaxis protein